MPKEGISRREYRIQKFGSWERSQELDARVIGVGKEEGIAFAFDRIERTPNTLAAHRLIWLAEKEGVQDLVVERLFRAYFIEGRDICALPSLVEVVVEAGLNQEKAEALLHGNDGLEALKEAGDHSGLHQVNGVPFFIVNQKVTLSGAQHPQTFLEAFERAEDR